MVAIQSRRSRMFWNKSQCVGDLASALVGFRRSIHRNVLRWTLEKSRWNIKRKTQSRLRLTHVSVFRRISAWQIALQKRNKNKNDSTACKDHHELLPLSQPSTSVSRPPANPDHVQLSPRQSKSSSCPLNTLWAINRSV